MRERSRKQSISALAALLLLGVFAAGILSVLLSGAGAYRRLTQRDRLSYDSRTCLQYVSTKIRQAPSPACVELSYFGDGDSLVISEEIEGANYCTQVYCHDGWLMELFTVADGAFAPEDGEKIMPVESLHLSRVGSLLRAELVDGNGTERTIVLHLRGGEGAQP